MPMFCYTTTSGKTVERAFRMGKAPERITLENGDRARRNITAEWAGRKRIPSIYPLVSDALGVNPNQIPEAVADSIEKGCPTEFTKDGGAKIPDEQHHTKMKRAYRFYDRNAGYSGVVPQ